MIPSQAVPIPQPMAPSPKQQIFISNIDKGLTEDYLFHILKDYGVIQNIKIPKDSNTGKPKGIAFVTFQKPEEAANARSNMNGKVLIKNKIKVKQYVDKNLIEKAANVFISGLPPQVEDEEIENFFETYGNIISVEIKRDENNKCHGYGYVQFEKKEEAQKLFQSSGDSHTVIMNGNPIKITEFVTSSQRNKNTQNIFLRAFCGQISADIALKEKDIADYETVWQYNIQNWCNQNNYETLNIFVKYDIHLRTPWALIAFKEEIKARQFLDYCEKHRRMPIENLEGAIGAYHVAKKLGAEVNNDDLFKKLNSKDDPFAIKGEFFFYNYQKSKSNVDIDPRILILRSLKPDVEVESLKQFLNQFGKVIRISIKAHRNPRFQLKQAVVTYQTVEDAKNCLTDIFKLHHHVLSQYFDSYPWVSILVNQVYRKELKNIKDQNNVYQSHQAKKIIMPMNSMTKNAQQQQQMMPNQFQKFRGPNNNINKPFQGQSRQMVPNQQQNKFAKMPGQFNQGQKFGFPAPFITQPMGIPQQNLINLGIAQPQQIQQSKPNDKYIKYEDIQADMQAFTQLTPSQQRMILGQLLSKRVSETVKDGNLVPKITGMLIDEKVFEIQEIMELFDSQAQFNERIEEAITLINDGN